MHSLPTLLTVTFAALASAAPQPDRRAITQTGPIRVVDFNNPSKVLGSLNAQGRWTAATTGATFSFNVTGTSLGSNFWVGNVPCGTHDASEGNAFSCKSGYTQLGSDNTGPASDGSILYGGGGSQWYAKTAAPPKSGEAFPVFTGAPSGSPSTTLRLIFKG